MAVEFQTMFSLPLSSSTAPHSEDEHAKFSVWFVRFCVQSSRVSGGPGRDCSEQASRIVQVSERLSNYPRLLPKRGIEP